MLPSSADLIFDTRLLERFADGLHRGVQEAHPLILLWLDQRAEMPPFLGIEILEGKILELRLDGAHTEAVSKRSVNIKRFPRYPLPLFKRAVAERAHIVEAVGKLYDDDSNVVRHREIHLAKVLSLTILLRLEIGYVAGLSQLCDAVDHAADILSEELVELLDRYTVAVLHNVVQEARGDGVGVHIHFAEGYRNGFGVSVIRFAGFPLLPFVRGLGKFRGALNELDLFRRILFLA